MPSTEWVFTRNVIYGQNCYNGFNGYGENELEMWAVDSDDVLLQYVIVLLFQ